jgi:hypothetical protein
MYQKNQSKWPRLIVFALGFGLLPLFFSSCSTLNRFMAHGGAAPVYVNNTTDKYYVDGKEMQVYMDIYRQTTEGNIRTTTYVPALRIPPNKKYVSVLRVESSGKRTVYLCRRKPIYLYFWFDQYLSFDLGTIIDIADNMIYDWEIVSTTELSK